MISKDLKFLSLIPALFLAFDFLPLWYIVSGSVILIYVSIFKTSKFIAYINLITPYFIFKEVGKRIVPETMVPIMCTFILSQIIINKSTNKSENYLLFLWVGAFSLFSSGFYYLSYAIICFLLLVIIENKTGDGLNLKRALKGFLDNYKQFGITLLLTVFLFIFFPRFHNFLPSANNQLQGRIGYSKSVNNSTTANLQLSSQTAFYAELSKNLPTSVLYWRGRTLAYTDGYNWRSKELSPQRIVRKKTDNLIKQSIKYEQDFDKDIILLNTPYEMGESNFRTYHIAITNEYKTYTKMKKSYLEAYSNLNDFPKLELKESNIEKLLQVPSFIPKEVKKFAKNIPSNNAKQIIASFEAKIKTDQFSYSLSPGFMPTMSDFLKNKKGFCTHFASLMGLIFRIKGIPARLVNGFQGGSYNEMGNFYEVKSNDAHTWVEYYDNGRFHMIDPTSFIAPDRINLGGEQYLSPAVIPGKSKNDLSIFKYFYQGKQFLDILNYRVSLFLDNYNKDKQKDLSKSLKLDIKYFFASGILIIIFTVWMYYFLRNKPKKVYIHPADKLLFKFGKKLKVTFIAGDKISNIKMKTPNFDSIREHKEFINLYTKTRYGRESHYDRLKQIIKNLGALK